MVYLTNVGRSEVSVLLPEYIAGLLVFVECFFNKKMIDQIDKGVTPAISLHVIDAMQNIICELNCLHIEYSFVETILLAMCMKCKMTF